MQTSCVSSVTLGHSEPAALWRMTPRTSGDPTAGALRMMSNARLRIDTAWEAVAHEPG